MGFDRACTPGPSSLALSPCSDDANGEATSSKANGKGKQKEKSCDRMPLRSILQGATDKQDLASALESATNVKENLRGLPANVIVETFKSKMAAFNTLKLEAEVLIHKMIEIESLMEYMQSVLDMTAGAQETAAVQIQKMAEYILENESDEGMQEAIELMKENAELFEQA